MTGDRKCIAQTYWYEDGVQRARYCQEVATTRIVGGDGIKWVACDEHASKALAAGARRADR